MSQEGKKSERWSHGWHGKDNKPEHVVFLGKEAEEKY